MPTDEMKQRIAEMTASARRASQQWIDSALAAAYIVDPENDYAVVALFGEYKEDGTLDRQFENAVANKEFTVKCCPAAVLALIAEIERLERENARLRKQIDSRRTTPDPGWVY